MKNLRRCMLHMFHARCKTFFIVPVILLSAFEHAWAHDEMSMNPLEKAAISGEVIALKSLLDRGAGVNQTTAYGDTLLHLALRRRSLERRRGQIGVVRLLVARGANVNAVNSRSMSPLMIAVRRNQPMVMKAILSVKPDLSLVDSQGRTALSYARGYQDTGMIEMLRSAGAVK